MSYSYLRVAGRPDIDDDLSEVDPRMTIDGQWREVDAVEAAAAEIGAEVVVAHPGVSWLQVQRDMNQGYAQTPLPNYSTLQIARR